jgi:ascorbate-specific PTS system EIIC-type component UlaA
MPALNQMLRDNRLIITIIIIFIYLILSINFYKCLCHPYNGSK